MAKKYAAIITATFMGIGYIPLAPGTAASAVVAFLWYLLRPEGTWWALVIAILLFYPATLAAEYADNMWNTHDNGRIVIDEVIGMLLPLSLAHTSLEIVVAFVLFRFFDISKPFPIRRIEKAVPGGLGVVVDDVVAGVYSIIFMLIFLVFNVF